MMLSRQGEAWSDEDIALLRQVLEAGDDRSTVALKLGRTKSAVSTKAGQLGLRKKTNGTGADESPASTFDRQPSIAMAGAEDRAASSSAPHQEYRRRAAECAKAAAETDLPNVRRQQLQAEARWTELADKAERVQAGFDERERARDQGRKR